MMGSVTTANVVFWFRRDLRLADQPGLAAAIARANLQGGAVVPLFVFDPALLDPSGINRKAFLFDALRSLVDQGVPLVLRDGAPEIVVRDIAAKYRASVVFCAGDYGPYGRMRDIRVEKALADGGVAFERVGSPYAVEPGTVRKLDGTPFKVFTPFSRVWTPLARDQAPVDPFTPGTTPWATTNADAIPTNPGDVAAHLPPATEAQAHMQLAAFLERAVDDYDEQRNVPSVEGTSRLSPYLKFGLLHPRQILPSLQQRRVQSKKKGGADGAVKSGADVFRSELCWREFYADVLWHQPETARVSYNRSMIDMHYDSDATADERFARWCTGTTGYPYVDAGMRQLLTEGWMHNRVRMAVASFLVKDLHIDWRRGAAWFMRHLVDGDLASNQHGWQWTAGTGTDASPYYRVFNPITQGKKFDANGEYVKRFVPELRNVTTKFIHEPWLMGEGDLFTGAPGYPPPIVDHGVEREEALRRYAQMKQTATTVAP
jgi:deoxyribodipyrimidine photo-lyase